MWQVDIRVDDAALDEMDVVVDSQVTATIPVATDYKHIHFGVWAGLSDAMDNGMQTLADLGIGFVQSVGDGMSGDDMPNSGGATYEGNWVAAVQKADVDGDGAISLQNGAATLTADFEDDEITAMLNGLVTLSGDISGNMFSGDEATVGTNAHGLTSGADFDGEFSGGFFGPKGAEAGGIFGFASEDNEDGAFRGAFGGDKK